MTTSLPRLALIAAVADNGIIGADGGLPWRLSTDMRRFKALTLGKPVIMGRKTYATLGKPLVDRTNIVVSHAPPGPAPGVIGATSVAAAIDTARRALAGGDEIMVIGGGMIYAATIGLADRLYITHVHATPDGDTFFPAIDPAVFAPVSRETIPAGAKDSHATEFVVYDRLVTPAEQAAR